MQHDEPDITCPSSYTYFFEQPLRYNDLDPLGHVTSLSILNLFETPRVLFLSAAGHKVDDPDFGWMLVNMQIDFRAQLLFPSVTRTGVRLARIGRSSVTTHQGLFSSETCHATLKSVLVLVDRATEAASEIPQDLRIRLESTNSREHQQGIRT